ncbi:unnamed protein product [Spirodela intermedia]|uniref:Thioredoxin domain-containing protein n=1 Tax=Spirodela intermedia TaxID=51605 RepID=A0A7I8IKA1_SPIIN|nr:unnamed protein product [Spirodela intermedia]CAA6658318.1 unnamed protein product [Spirodela intermedia]
MGPLHRSSQAQGCPVSFSDLSSPSPFIFCREGEGGVVFVHFTASWCVPSVAMNPSFEALAQSYQDVLFLLWTRCERMGVKAMPTFLLISEGSVVDKIVGANPDEIRKRMDGFIQSFHGHSEVESI